jgi:hypothetical protein
VREFEEAAVGMFGKYISLILLMNFSGTDHLDTKSISDSEERRKIITAN